MAMTDMFCCLGEKIAAVGVRRTKGSSLILFVVDLQMSNRVKANTRTIISELLAAEKSADTLNSLHSSRTTDSLNP